MRSVHRTTGASLQWRLGPGALSVGCCQCQCGSVPVAPAASVAQWHSGASVSGPVEAAAPLGYPRPWQWQAPACQWPSRPRHTTGTGSVNIPLQVASNASEEYRDTATRFKSQSILSVPCYGSCHLETWSRSRYSPKYLGSVIVRDLHMVLVVPKHHIKLDWNFRLEFAALMIASGW
jgi:hypothetical protein